MDNKIKLHLGCGNVLLPDYINIDKEDCVKGRDLVEPPKPEFWYVFGDPTRVNLATTKKGEFLQLDVMEIDRFFPAESVDEIYSAYLLEHLTSQEIFILMYKFHSVLKPKGKLITIVPDFYEIMRYFNHPHRFKVGNHLQRFEMEIFGPPDEYTKHKSIWTPRLAQYYIEQEKFFIMDVLNYGRDGLSLEIYATKRG